MPTWEEKLADGMDPQLAAEIGKFDTEIALRKRGKLDEKNLFRDQVTPGTLWPALR